MKECEQVNLAQSIRNLRDNMPAMLDLSKMNAQLCRAKFIALVEEGFTEARALDLCWRL